MNVEMGTEAVQFPEKEFINRIYDAVQEYTTWNSTYKKQATKLKIRKKYIF
jgi:hypothetical protein